MGALLGTGSVALLASEMSKKRNQENIFHGYILSEAYEDEKRTKSYLAHEGHSTYED